MGAWRAIFFFFFQYPFSTATSMGALVSTSFDTSLFISQFSGAKERSRTVRISARLKTRLVLASYCPASAGLGVDGRLPLDRSATAVGRNNGLLLRQKGRPESLAFLLLFAAALFEPENLVVWCLNCLLPYPTLHLAPGIFFYPTIERVASREKPCRSLRQLLSPMNTYR